MQKPEVKPEVLSFSLCPRKGNCCPQVIRREDGSWYLYDDENDSSLVITREEMAVFDDIRRKLGDLA